MSYFIVLCIGILFGYVVRVVDLTAREYRASDRFDVFPDVHEPISHVVDVSDAP